MLKNGQMLYALSFSDEMVGKLLIHNELRLVWIFHGKSVNEWYLKLFLGMRVAREFVQISPEPQTPQHCSVREGRSEVKATELRWCLILV